MGHGSNTEIGIFEEKSIPMELISAAKNVFPYCNYLNFFLVASFFLFFPLQQRIFFSLREKYFYAKKKIFLRKEKIMFSHSR